VHFPVAGNQGTAVLHDISLSVGLPRKKGGNGARRGAIAGSALKLPTRLQRRADHGGQVHHPVGIARFIVVPGEHFNHLVDNVGGLGIDDG
jgi:hypothetical protein